MTTPPLRDRTGRPGVVAATNGQVSGRVSPRLIDLLDAIVADSSVRPVIDLSVPFEEAARAIDHVGAGRAHGKVVVRVDPSL